MNAYVRYQPCGEPENEHLVVVTINRSERRNAVGSEVAEQLAAAFRRFDADDGSRVAILTGAEGCFCAGADLKGIAEGSPNRVERDGDGPMGISRMLLSKPVIAAIEGYAVAGGLELALWCDMRVVADDAKLGVLCRRWGVPLLDGGTVRLPRLIGHSHALDLILTGREVFGEEALRMGLANRLTKPGQALDEALALARQLAGLPQRCLRSDRLSSYDQWSSSSLEEALIKEFEHGVETCLAPDFLDNVKGFQRRPR